MLRNFFVVVFIIVMTICCACNKKTAETEINTGLKIQNVKINEGERLAPDFSLYTPYGQKISLSDYSGKIVILDFWAMWCPPCKKGIPDLISIQVDYKNDLVVIGVSLDQPSMQKDLPQFIKENGINFPIVIGTQDVAANYGNIQAIPTTFIINRKRKIINEHIGIVPISTLQKEIDSVLDGS